MARIGTDWEKLKNMTDAEKLANALSDPENPPVREEEAQDFVRANDIPGEKILEKYRNLREKKYKRLVSVRYDADMLDYFKAKGKGYQAMMNDALHAFMEAEKAGQL